jgi:hypothetical protein
MWIAPHPLAMENDMTGNNAQRKIADVARLQEKQNAPAASPADVDSSCCRALLEQAPILEDEDQELYKQIHNAVFDDVRPQTFLENLAAKVPFDPVLLSARIEASLDRKRLRDREQAFLNQLKVEGTLTTQSPWPRWRSACFK